MAPAEHRTAYRTYLMNALLKDIVVITKTTGRSTYQDQQYISCKKTFLEAFLDDEVYINKARLSP